MGERRGGEKDDNAIDEENDGGFFLFSPIVCCFTFVSIIGLVPVLLFLLAMFSQGINALIFQFIFLR